MKFKCNTKPLADGLNLGVINANVSKFYKKSCLAQLTAHSNCLVVNLEAASILTEIRVKGTLDCDVSESGVSVFVDSLLLKQLMGTIETNTIDIEFNENGIIIYSGKSKFTLPKMLEGDQLSLGKPNAPTSQEFIKVDKEGWKFIKDRQMFALSMSFITPVYTKVWIGESGDVLVGDFENSLFTHSKKGNLGSTCLVSDTIVNLMTSLPDEAVILKNSETSYLIKIENDALSYMSEFTPQFEDETTVGVYHSEMIIPLLDPSISSVGYVPAKLKSAPISKLLSQALLLASTSDETIDVRYADKCLDFHNSSVSGKFDADMGGEDFKMSFSLASLKSVVANYEDEDIQISPVLNDGEVVGLIVKDDNISTVISAKDE